MFFRTGDTVQMYDSCLTCEKPWIMYINSANIVREYVSLCVCVYTHKKICMCALFKIHKYCCIGVQIKSQCTLMAIVKTFFLKHEFSQYS